MSKRTRSPAGSPTAPLSRRERQIMDIVIRHGRATAAEVRDELPDPPSYSAVRALLRILEEKGHLRHESEGPRYVYRPTFTRDQARRSAVQHLVETFFGGSVVQAVSTLLEQKDAELSDADLEQLEALIDKSRREGR